MAAGVPVVTSTAGALPEIAGDAAMLVDPRSSTDIAQALERVLDSSVLRERMRTASRSNAERFRWGRAAAETWAFFEQLL
jgi:glycosyltransferase involved in cell wall biosynthesis